MVVVIMVILACILHVLITFDSPFCFYTILTRQRGIVSVEVIVFSYHMVRVIAPKMLDTCVLLLLCDTISNGCRTIQIWDKIGHNRHATWRATRVLVGFPSVTYAYSHFRARLNLGYLFERKVFQNKNCGQTKQFVGDTPILKACGFQNNFAEFSLVWSCWSCSDKLLC